VHPGAARAAERVAAQPRHLSAQAGNARHGRRYVDLVDGLGDSRGLAQALADDGQGDAEAHFGLLDRRQIQIGVESHAVIAQQHHHGVFAQLRCEEALEEVRQRAVHVVEHRHVTAVETVAARAQGGLQRIRKLDARGRREGNVAGGGEQGGEEGVVPVGDGFQCFERGLEEGPVGESPVSDPFADTALEEEVLAENALGPVRFLETVGIVEAHVAGVEPQGAGAAASVELLQAGDAQVGVADVGGHSERVGQHGALGTELAAHGLSGRECGGVGLREPDGVLVEDRAQAREDVGADVRVLQLQGPEALDEQHDRIHRSVGGEAQVVAQRPDIRGIALQGTQQRPVRIPPGPEERGRAQRCADGRRAGGAALPVRLQRRVGARAFRVR
jgi:hypothetical protein